jgi:hypothetical protein
MRLAKKIRMGITLYRYCNNSRVARAYVKAIVRFAPKDCRTLADIFL